MTRSKSKTKPLKVAPSHEELRAFLKRHDLSVTQQRLSILELLSNEHACLAVDDLVTESKKQKLESGDWSTVFRTLKTFEETGLVTAFDSSDGVTRYELKHENEDHHHHHHFVCRSCKSIATLDECPEQLFVKAAKKIGFKVEKHLIEVEGICKDCQ